MILHVPKNNGDYKPVGFRQHPFLSVDKLCHRIAHAKRLFEDSSSGFWRGHGLHRVRGAKPPPDACFALPRPNLPQLESLSTKS